MMDAHSHLDQEIQQQYVSASFSLRRQTSMVRPVIASCLPVAC